MNELSPKLGKGRYIGWIEPMEKLKTKAERTIIITVSKNIKWE